MRLFVAIELQAEALSAVAAEARRLRLAAGRDAAIRWVRPEHLHLTLAFLGEVEPARAQALVAAMGQPFSQPSFHISFDRLGVFPSHGAPRVLWVGVADDAELVRLQKTVVDRLTNLGLPLDAGAFHAHLTLGRWKRSRPSERRRILAAGFVPVRSVGVDAVALIESRLVPGGPEYSVLARAALATATRG